MRTEQCEEAKFTPVESLQHRVICQRDLIHQKHAILFHRQDQWSIMPLKQTAVLGISLKYIEFVLKKKTHFWTQ